MGRLVPAKWWLLAILSVLLLKANLRLLEDYDFFPETSLDNQPHVPHAADSNPTPKDDDKSRQPNKMVLPYNQHNLNGNTEANASLPYFVIHMGPPKTATSSLQEELTARHYRNLLAADNYVYTGAYMKDGQLMRFDTYSTSNSKNKSKNNNATRAIKQAMTDLECQAAVHKARTSSNHHTATTYDYNATIISSRSDDWYPPSCWQHFLRALDEFQGRNILISQEIMSFRLIRTDAGLAPVDWVALQQALSGRWNLLVVVAYRRLTEWLPSAKQQNERWNALKPAMNNWPGYGNRPGKRIQPIFPHVLHHLSCIDGSQRPPKWLRKNNRKFRYLYVNNVLELLSAHGVPVQILNLHRPEPLLVTFFCHVLPGAETNCAVSRQLAVDGNSEKRANREQSVAYDILATAAAVLGLVDRSVWARHTVAVAAREHHERVLNGTRFIRSCPVEQDLELYLKASLRVEEELLPDFYQSDAGETQHRADFIAAVARQKYCWINAKEVLEQTVWRDFFRNTFSSSPNNNDKKSAVT
jgi:hypothetical protein